MTATVTSIFIALFLCGLLGMLGQGVRALTAIKPIAAEVGSQDASSADLYIASRLAAGLMIGFLVGIAGGLSLGLKRILAIGDGDIELLLGIAAAGYAGTDFIESFLQGIGSKLKASGPASPKQPSNQPPTTKVPPPQAAKPIGNLDPLSAVILNLLARDHALDEATAALMQDLKGDPVSDAPGLLKLGEMAAERAAIAARRGIIMSGGTFSPPSPAQINGLQAAITALHKDVVANADTETLLKTASTLLRNFGARDSK